MSNAVHLSLLIGPIIPLPVPAMLIDALEEVTVTSASEGASGFQLRFKVNSKSELNTLFLITVGNNTSPGTPPLRVVLIVTLGGRPQPLFDGVLTNVEVQAGQNRQPGSITITGEDLTKVMDLIDFSGMPYPAMPIEARVALICAKYAAFGIIPLPIPSFSRMCRSPSSAFPPSRAPTWPISASWPRKSAMCSTSTGRGAADQHRLLRPGDQSRPAAAGAEHRYGRAHQRRVAELQLRPDQGRAAGGVHPEPDDPRPIPIPIPNLNPLQPPLGVLSTPLANIKMMKDTAKMNPMQAISAGLAEAKKSQDA